jgi:hypothetical protein
MEKSHQIGAGSWQCSAFSTICLLVKVGALEIFLFVATGVLVPAPLLRATLSKGATYSISFVDIDGNKLSTSDGHVTVVVLAATADREKARAVGDHVPDNCLGNPNYRMITIIYFTGRHTVIGRRIATTFIRHRVREEAKRLQARYGLQKLSRDAKGDIFIVTDFDGTAASQLGKAAGTTDFSVLVFGRTGELLAQWSVVPTTAQLAAVLKCG